MEERSSGWFDNKFEKVIYMEPMYLEKELETSNI